MHMGIVATLCGLKRGFVRRSLPGVVAAGRLPASTENAL
jgi:hypothetical protein